MKQNYWSGTTEYSKRNVFNKIAVHEHRQRHRLHRRVRGGSPGAGNSPAIRVCYWRVYHNRGGSNHHNQKRSMR